MTILDVLEKNGHLFVHYIIPIHLIILITILQIGLLIYIYEKIK